MGVASTIAILAYAGLPFPCYKYRGTKIFRAEEESKPGTPAHEKRRA